MSQITAGDTNVGEYHKAWGTTGKAIAKSVSCRHGPLPPCLSVQVSPLFQYPAFYPFPKPRPISHPGTCNIVPILSKQRERTLLLRRNMPTPTTLGRPSAQPATRFPQADPPSFGCKRRSRSWPNPLHRNGHTPSKMKDQYNVEHGQIRNHR